MEELFNYGMNDNDIKNMIEINSEIMNLTNQEIIQNIEILKNIKCDERHIKNILTSNPFYLSRCSGDVLDLIKKLTDLGVNSLNILFDSNPWLLNKDVFEIDDYIDKKRKEGISLGDIVDMIDSNPYIIDGE